MRFAQNNTKFKMLESIIQKHGFKVAVLIRLSPLLPFEVENYVLGVSSIRFWHYTFGLIALIPGCALYCILGSTVSNLSDISNVEQALTTSPVGLSLIVVSLVAMVVATIAAARKFEAMEDAIAEEQLVDSIESTVEIYCGEQEQEGVLVAPDIEGKDALKPEDDKPRLLTCS